MTGLLPKKLDNRHLVVADAIAAVLSPLTAFLVRFEDAGWLVTNARMVLAYLVVSVPLRLMVFHSAGLYRRLWRHASVGELRQIIFAGGVAGILCAIIGLFIFPAAHITETRVPFSVLFIDGFLTTAAIGFPRLLARTLRGPHLRRRHDDQGRRVLIAGAGDAAKQVVKELRNTSKLGFEPIGFVDDDPTKHNHTLLDLPVFGPLASIRQIVEENAVAEIIIAMPSAPGSVVRRVVRASLDAGIPTLTVPSLPEILARHGDSSLREVEIQDLLRREPVETDLASVAAMATGETVLITGAAGSID